HDALPICSTVRELAELVGGRVDGDGAAVVQAARPLGEAGPGDITFAEDERHMGEIGACPAIAAVVGIDAPPIGKALIRVDDPRAAFAAIVDHLHGRSPRPIHGTDKLASVDPTAVIGADASIEPFAVIGGGTVVGTRC